MSVSAKCESLSYLVTSNLNFWSFKLYCCVGLLHLQLKAETAWQGVNLWAVHAVEKHTRQ